MQTNMHLPVRRKGEDTDKDGDKGTRLRATYRVQGNLGLVQVYEILERCQ